MRTVTNPSEPVKLSRCPMPPGIEQRTARARALGLSLPQQVTRLARSGRDIAKRLRRMKRVVGAAAEKIGTAYAAERRRYRAAMVTLTYRPGEEWSPRDITGFLKRARAWLARRKAPLRAVWVLELQKRGAPHYHVLLWLPRGLTLPKPDKRGWWTRGSTRIEWARNPVRYLTKYASKGDAHADRLPRGARIFSVLGCPANLSWWRAAAWLRAIASPGQSIRYRRGGWWIVEELAHAWRTPWRVVAIGAESIDIAWIGWSDHDIVSIWELEAWQTQPTHIPTPPPAPRLEVPIIYPPAALTPQP